MGREPQNPIAGFNFRDQGFSHQAKRKEATSLGGARLRLCVRRPEGLDLSAELLHHASHTLKLPPVCFLIAYCGFRVYLFSAL